MASWLSGWRVVLLSAILEIEPKEIPKNLYKSDNKKNKAIGRIRTKYGGDRSAVQASVQNASHGTP